MEYDGDKLTPGERCPHREYVPIHYLSIVVFLEVNSEVHMAISNISLPTIDVFTVPSSDSG